MTQLNRSVKEECGSSRVIRLLVLFITIVVDQWHGGKHHLPTLLGFTISLVCLAAFGPDRFLIPAMLLILAAVYGIRGREETP